MSKHSDLANRIFRTVVFSGAMLGGVAPALADSPAPPKQAAKADTWDSVNKEIEANDKKLDAAIVKLIAAIKNGNKEGGGTGMALAQGTYDDLRKKKTELDARLAGTTRPAFANEKAIPEVEKTEKALADADTKLFAAIDGISAENKATITAAETARKERIAAAAKVKAARTKANRRPRAPVTERPTGRGFVLS